MHILRDARLRLAKTLRELAHLCEIPAQRLSDYERGASQPPFAEASRLEQGLEIPVVPSRRESVPFGILRRVTRPNPYELPPVDKHAWVRARSYWADSTRNLKISQRKLNWLRACFPCDSAPEAHLDLALAAESRVGRANPHTCGFRHQGIVDIHGRPLGERRLPFLYWQRRELHCILWPQINVKPNNQPFRLDMLVAARWKRKFSWIDLELDGPDHDPKKDAYRRELLQMPEIRLPVQLMTRPNILDVLEARLIEQFSHRRIAA